MIAEQGDWPALPHQERVVPRSATAGTYQAGRTPFVGRGPELAALRERLAAAGHGAGAVVLLAGEPGIGKTRTAEEFATVAEEHGAAVLWGRCLEGEGAPPFWPWIQILRSHARDCDPAILRAELGTGGADLAQIAPLLRERVPDLPPLPTAAPDPSRFRLFDAVTTFLRNVAAARRSSSSWTTCIGPMRPRCACWNGSRAS